MDCTAHTSSAFVAAPGFPAMRTHQMLADAAMSLAAATAVTYPPASPAAVSARPPVERGPGH